jgi:uncharacterized cysteine cluster protein YcgN (CxxCxxCC family)
MNLTQKLLTSLLLIIFLDPSFAEDRALLVGIDKYWYANLLRGSKEDVKEMQRSRRNDKERFLLASK